MSLYLTCSHVKVMNEGIRCDIFRDNWVQNRPVDISWLVGGAVHLLRENRRGRLNVPYFLISIPLSFTNLSEESSRKYSINFRSYDLLVDKIRLR